MTVKVDMGAPTDSAMDTAARKALLKDEGRRGLRFWFAHRLRLIGDHLRFLRRDAELRYRRRHVRLEDLVLPPIAGSYPDPAMLGDRLLVFTACDRGYFDRYYAKLVHSLEQNSPDVALHLHIFDPPDEEHLARIEALRRRCPRLLLTCSSEHAPSEGRDSIYRITYYASMRFLRLYQMMRLVGRDVLAIDVDTLILRPLDELAAFMGNAEVSFRSRFHHPDPRRRMLAGVIFLRNRPRALRYLGNVALRIAKHLLEPGLLVQWYLDQRILHLEFKRERRRFNRMRWKRLHMRFIDWHYDEDSVIWVGKGRRKDENMRYMELGERLLAQDVQPSRRRAR